jgi:hypothetical protein
MGLAVGAPLALARGFAFAAEPDHPPDLADTVAGGYFGDVVSDSAGSSKSNVSLTLSRVGPNRVSISSDYPRLPQLVVDLETAMDRIVNSGGDSPFVFDPATGKLDISFHDEVSWSGVRR